jgi:hypothetical protein
MVQRCPGHQTEGGSEAEIFFSRSALRRAGISAADAERVLARQLACLDGLIGERHRLVTSQPNKMLGKALGGRAW